MIATCLRAGWRAAFERPRLIVTVWFWNAVLAAAAGFGAWRWLSAAFNYSPEADKALERFPLALLLELLQYDRFSPLTLLNGAALGLLVAALLSNPLITGGVLEVLVSRDDRPLLHRFFRGGGHFYGRFLRLLMISGVALLVLVIAAGLALRPIVTALGESSWERTWLAAALLRLAILGGLAGLVMAVLDVARARVATAGTEIRGMLRAWIGAARSVLAHFVAAAGIYLTLGIVWVVLAVAGLWIVSIVPVTGWASILLLIVVQQAFMIARAALRVVRAAASVAWVSLAVEREARVPVSSVPNPAAL